MRRDVFQAIADPVRRQILEIISDGPITVNEVAERFKISRQAISKQLKILNECGMLDTYKQGRNQYYSINPQSLIPAYLWVEQLHKQWQERIDSFESYVMKLKENRDGK